MKYSPIITDEVRYKDAHGFRPSLKKDMDDFDMTKATPVKLATNDSYVADSRYPALAAVMSDARLFTDYRPRCSANIPPASQFKTKQWMTDNAVQLIDESRRRQADRLGATVAGAQLYGPGAASVQHCTPDSCSIVTSDINGIGIERRDTLPPLFGTFKFGTQKQAEMKASPITQRPEGGRNAIRGYSSNSSKLMHMDNTM